MDYKVYEDEFVKENLKEISNDAGKVFDTIMELSKKLDKMVVSDKSVKKMK